jgi:phosphatidylethanolamine N-methyltransferase
MWLPVHDEEWDGDIPLGLDGPPSPQRDSESGVVSFKGNTLPWLVGKYEVGLCDQNILGRISQDLTQHFQVRYHHDGKYNVMSSEGSFQINGKSWGRSFPHHWNCVE